MKKILFILLLCFLFFSCVTSPVERKHFSVTKNLSESLQTEEKTPLLKIYFPEFYDITGDVYEGDGTLIILPDNKVILVDGFESACSESIMDFLRSLNISKIDYLIGTHYHADHIGTFSDIIANFEIGNLYTNGAPINNNVTPGFLEAIDEYQIKHIILKEGDELDLFEGCHAKIFWPTLTEKDIYDVMYKDSRTAEKINMTSLVTKIIFKDFSLLLPGDVYKAGEKQIVQKYGSEIKSTISKASHHGDWYTANLPEFVNTVKADYAVIQDNRYITSKINRIYKKAGSKILYRLTPGYILITTDGSSYTVSEKSFSKKVKN